MKKLFAGATLLLLGVGAGAQVQAAVTIGLKGSDTLEDVTKDVIAACPALIADTTNQISYVGGGSGGGESAMIAATPTQQIAPMSRALSTTAAIGPLTLCDLNVAPGCTTACSTATDAGCTGTSPTNGKRVACDSSKGAQELLVGLDGIAVVGANQTGGDSVGKTAAAADDCGDSIVGGQTVACTSGVDPGCAADNLYHFADWRDVLAVVYGGQYHSDAAGGTPALTVNESPLAADPRYCQTPAPVAHKVRNPARVNCAGTVRQNLVNSWGKLFADAGAGAPGVCRSGNCVKLKHAFRRGDLSGTTDTFVGLVGLIAIPAQTNCANGNFPGISNAATANPFCNAGEAPMNKGDSDYLDLDPIRRIADSEAATFAVARQGMEQVSEGYRAPANPPTTRGNDNRTEPPVAVLKDLAYSNFQNIGFDPNNAGFAQFLTDEAAALAARNSLGLVLTIEIPTNFQDDQVAYWSPSTAAGQAPVKCAPGVFALSNVGNGVICPDGSPQPCLLPVDAAGTNFNCLTDAPSPAASPLRDSRVYNLWVVSTIGKFVKDNYLNPGLTLSAARQNRAVSGFFRLHTNQVTNFGATPKIAQANTGVCKQFTSTDQIGCLVKANPCSIGFAGREAVTADNTSMGYRIGLNSNTDVTAGLSASQANIESLVTGGTPYAIARKLWVNSYKGLANVTNTNGATTTHELDLLNCFGASGSTSIVDSKITGRNFIAVPSGVTRTVTCTP